MRPLDVAHGVVRHDAALHFAIEASEGRAAVHGKGSPIGEGDEAGQSDGFWVIDGVMARRVEVMSASTRAVEDLMAAPTFGAIDLVVVPHVDNVGGFDQHVSFCLAPPWMRRIRSRATLIEDRSGLAIRAPEECA